MRSHLLTTLAVAAVCIVFARAVGLYVVAQFSHVHSALQQTGVSQPMTTSTIHIDLTHVPVAALLVIALGCIPLVQGLTEALKRGANANGIKLSPFAIQTLAIAAAVLCVEIGAMVKMAIDLSDALILAILGVGVGFAASGHRNYLTDAEDVVSAITQTASPDPVPAPAPPPAA